MEDSVETMWTWGKPLPLLAWPSGLPKMTPTNAVEGFMGSVLNARDVGVANAEAVNDRAKLLMHRLIARRIRLRPDLIETAKMRIAQKRQVGPLFDYIPEWESLLSQDAETLCRSITSRGETMIRLRLSSPLVDVVDFRDPQLRRRIWRKAKQGLR